MLRSFARERARIALTIVAFTVVCWWLTRPSPPDDEEERSEQDALEQTAPPSQAERWEEQLAAALARQGLLLQPGSFVLPEVPPAGGWGPIAWRAALLSASTVGAAASGQVEDGDIYRAELRFAADDTLLDLRRLANVTDTASSLEELLYGAGPLSLWSVRVGGLIQEVLLVDARRDHREFEDGAGRMQHLLARLTNRLQTGQWSGVGVRTYHLLTPATRIEVTPQEEGRLVALGLYRGSGSTDGRVVFDLAAQQVVEGKEELSHTPSIWAGTPVIHWIVDTVRSLSWVGPRPIALLEKWVFSAENALASLGYRLGLVHEANMADELGLAATAGGEIRIEAAPPGGDPDWPPPALPPLLPGGQPGEGQWFSFTAPWLKTIPGAPPAFYKTALRMPGSPPYLVVLVAMDLRQMDLDMVAGMGTPWSSTGRQGSGRIPREPERLARTVAAFNGGFQTAHGAFGMMVDRVLVLEPWQKSATLALLEDGTLRMGTWNNSIDVPDDIVSFRQNMPPLLEDGVWNPAKQRYWGGTVSDLDKVNTSRSAMGYRGNHVLYYAWSERISAQGIAEALLHAGCEYGIHLDMNPAHAGMGLLDIDPSKMKPQGKSIPKDGYSALAPTKGQSFNLDRFVNRNGKDFFYLMLRQTLPQRLPLPPAGFMPWEGRIQPESPSGFLPVVAVARDPSRGDLLLAFDRPRLRAVFQLGARDARLQDDAPGTPAEAERSRARLSQPVALIDLGSIDAERPVGLAASGRTLSPFVGTWSTLAVDGQGGLALLPPGAADRAAQPDRRQGCPLLLAGRLSARGSAMIQAAAGRRHHVLGLDDAGMLYYLASSSDAPALAEALGQLGVQDALLLPDGEAPRVSLLQAGESGLLAEDPLSGQQRPLTALSGSGSRILLDRLPEPPRIARLRMPDVELSPEEQARQNRIQARIMEKRAELRSHANEVYREYIEKVRAEREAKEKAKGD